MKFKVIMEIKIPLGQTVEQSFSVKGASHMTILRIKIENRAANILINVIKKHVKP